MHYISSFSNFYFKSSLSYPFTTLSILISSFSTWVNLKVIFINNLSIDHVKQIHIPLNSLGNGKNVQLDFTNYKMNVKTEMHLKLTEIHGLAFNFHVNIHQFDNHINLRKIFNSTLHASFCTEKKSSLVISDCFNATVYLWHFKLYFQFFLAQVDS